MDRGLTGPKQIANQTALSQQIISPEIQYAQERDHCSLTTPVRLQDKATEKNWLYGVLFATYTVIKEKAFKLPSESINWLDVTSVLVGHVIGLLLTAGFELIDQGLGW